jgi:hypothetical protein
VNVEVEIRGSVARRGAPKLVPIEDRYKHIGFTSIYAFPPAVADRIKTQRSTRGIRDCAVYSDTLFVDFDNAEAAAERLRSFLAGNDIAFDMYHSGGRSIHFHVDLDPMTGPGVPRAQRAWMEAHAPEADMSIYKQSGMFRLPGTYHSKHPGKRKLKIGQHRPGERLKIEVKPTLSEAPHGNSNADYYRFLGCLLCQRVGSGGRNNHAYKICKAAYTAGLDEAETRELLFQWNMTSCDPPQEDHELLTILESAYR